MAKRSTAGSDALRRLIRRIGPLGTGIAAALILLVVIGSLLAWILHAGLAQHESLARERLRGIALAGAGLIDIEAHEKLHLPEQTRSADYVKAIDRLVDFHNRLPFVVWIYTVRIVDGKLHYVLDTLQSPRLTLERDPIGSARVMDLVTEFSLADDPRMWNTVLAGRVYVEPESYEYAGQLLRSADAPLFDAAGRVIGALMIDVDVADFERERSQFVVLMVSSGVFIALFAVAVGFVIARAHVRLAAAIRELEVQSSTDSLTGLYNRGHFTRWMESAIPQARRQGRPLTVLVFDIDHFKRINDSLGHPAGDEVLRVLGTRLRRVVRGGEVCCRIGGEEFAVIMPGGSAEDAGRLYQRLSAALRDPITIAGHPLVITVSAGIAELPEREGNEADLMRAADTALYAAKSAGRDRVVRYGAA